jgi:excisionase family DNA binding protein
MPGPDVVPKLLTMDELAERLGVTPRHIRRLVADRRVPFLKVGRFIRFDPAAIAAWLDSQRVPTSEDLATPAPVCEGPARMGPDETRSTSEQ